MVTLRLDYQQRMAALFSDEAELARAEERAADMGPPRGKGGRPPRVLSQMKAAAVLEDLERGSFKWVAGKHDLSVGWLHEARKDGRLRRWAGEDV